MSTEQQRIGVLSNQAFGPSAIFTPSALLPVHSKQLDNIHCVLMAKKWLVARAIK